jgi:hypothetical protein
MTSNNEGQLCGALSSLRHIRHGNLSEAASCIFFSFFFLFSRDRGRVPRLFVFFLSSFLNKVTEDGFCLPRLPPVHALARCSAAWQFYVVPDRGRIRRLGQRDVLGTAASASSFHSSREHYLMFLQPLFSVGQAFPWPVLTGTLRRNRGIRRVSGGDLVRRSCSFEIGSCSSFQRKDFVVCFPRS